MTWRVLVFLALSLITGCVGNNATQKVADSPYYPLQVGNKWVFQGTEGKRLMTIPRHAEKAGKKCAVVETLVNDKLVSQEHVYADEKGLFVLAIGGKTLTQPLPFLRLPPTKGRTWKVHFPERNETSIFVIGADRVTVPFGTYDAITLRIDVLTGGTKTLSNVYWLARDVGIVKHMIRKGDKTFEFDLVEFIKGKIN